MRDIRLERLGIIAIIAAAIMAMIPPAAGGQGVAGASVRGTVSTETGSPVPNARVSLISMSTGNVFRVTASERGTFYFDTVPTGGPYTLEAAAIGVRPAAIAGIVLHLGDQIVRALALITGFAFDVYHSEAIGINDQGYVVGNSWSSTRPDRVTVDGFLWSPSGEYRKIPAPSGRTFIHLTGINNKGQTVGFVQ